MFDFKGLVFEELAFPPDGHLGTTVDAVVDEVSGLDELILDYLVEAGVLVAGWACLPDVLAGAELSKVLCCFGTDILKEFNCEFSDLLFVEVDFEEDHWVVLAPEHPGHQTIIKKGYQ